MEKPDVLASQPKLRPSSRKASWSRLTGMGALVGELAGLGIGGVPYANSLWSVNKYLGLVTITTRGAYEHSGRATTSGCAARDCRSAIPGSTLDLHGAIELWRVGAPT